MPGITQFFGKWNDYQTDEADPDNHKKNRANAKKTVPSDEQKTSNNTESTPSDVAALNPKYNP